MRIIDGSKVIIFIDILREVKLSFSVEPDLVWLDDVILDHFYRLVTIADALEFRSQIILKPLNFVSQFIFVA